MREIGIGLLGLGTVGSGVVEGLRKNAELISKRTGTNQGASMGLGTSFISLGRIVGPIWAGMILDVNVDYPYVSGAAIMFIGLLISLIWVRQRSKGAQANASMDPHARVESTLT